MAAVTICSDFGVPKNKVWHCLHCFPIYFPWSDGPDAMTFVFWILSFKPSFSLSSFTFIKRLLSSSSLSAIRVVSSTYLRLLIFLLVIWIPAMDLPKFTFYFTCLFPATTRGFPGGSDWGICLKYGRVRFDPQLEKMPWRRALQPTPEFLPEEFHGQRSPAVYRVHGAAKIWTWWRNYFFLANTVHITSPGIWVLFM